ncbi:hypothetical protein [Streptomyces griseomycini]|uniref:Chaplin domain-containing protein n=1 Tax=Streptomyces griseomycini TaxID=66895 RepID=A0A7W7PX65_9ACTN|nr:hypothetical protein [Streptomyces griseomycini]MBB4903002.1 hypothetical protein [Streptomyces griseomycini]GGR50857.1 hypothetical protein GCM10015536_65560 [Streptomyces griseomycini]
MNAQRVRRFFAVSAVGVLMAGGATIGAASTASAAAPASSPALVSRDSCGPYGLQGHNCHFHDGFNNNNDVVVVVVVV